jgi:hypothetical protein
MRPLIDDTVSPRRAQEQGFGTGELPSSRRSGNVSSIYRLGGQYMKAFPKARLEGMVIQECDDDLLVYDSNDHRAMSLNKVSAQIWKECTGENDIDSIAERTGLPREMIVLGVSRLQTHKLISPVLDRDEVVPPRRTFMKYAAAACLPVIMVIVAPSAIHAASACIPDGGIFTLMSTDTNDCFTPVNFNMCCSKSVKFTASDGISTVSCTCGTVVIGTAPPA